MEEMCFEPCPQDCEMSAWSDWTKCHVTKCGIGYQNRTRYVIEPELDGGRRCPDLYEGEVRRLLFSRRNGFFFVVSMVKAHQGKIFGSSTEFPAL